MNADERAKWLEKRRKGIGGSDIAAICGMSPYKTALGVYLEKRGLLTHSAEPDFIHWGHVLEPVILAEYAASSGFDVRQPKTKPWFSTERDWQFCTPDGLVGAKKIELGVEAKTSRTAEYWGANGSDKIPWHYHIQCQWSMNVVPTSKNRWDCAVLIGGSDFRVMMIEGDPRLQCTLIDRAKRFWFDNVCEAKPPAPVNGDADNIARLWPRNTGFATLRATGETNKSGMRLAEIRAALRDLEAEKERIENGFKFVLGAENELRGDGWSVKFGDVNNTRFDLDAAIKAGAITAEAAERFKKNEPYRKLYFKSEK